MSKVVTANTLATGTVVFLAADGWVCSIDQALIYADEAAAEAGLARAKIDEDQAIVVEPFVTDAGPKKEGRPAMTLRDTIRAYGPTIHFLPADAKVARG